MEPKRDQREPNQTQSEPMNLQKQHLCNRVEKVSNQLDSRDYPPEPFFIKIYKNNIPKKHEKTNHQQSLKSMPKGCQHGAKIDAKTNYKSMPKLVTKKVMKIINKRVFLNSNSCKNNSF